LATRKTCQNDEIDAIWRAFVGGNPARSGSVDIALAGPYLCPIISMAMAFILLAFLPLNLGLPDSHSIGG